MTFHEENKLYHEANKICQICEKEQIKKVRDQCHKIDEYRGRACNI